MFRGIATLATVAILVGSGCAVLSPRFPDDVQTAVVRDSMRRMETETLVVYYPEGRAEQARRMAARIAYCTRELRVKAPIRDAWTDQKPRIVMASLPFNNAYVSPPGLSEPISVIPAYNTTEYFAPFNLPPDPGVIGCHEAVHYVQLLQTSGIHRFFTTIFGSGYTPQIGLEPWFHEGVAVYYETKLQGGIGRLGTRYYEGVLAAGVAGRSVHGGWLHFANREPTHGAHYLTASFFVDWLVRNHGEDKLWKVVERQAKAVLPPFGVNGRFDAVYGKSLSTLIDEFAADLAKRYPVEKRDADQRVLQQLGSEARFRRTSDGWEAVIDRALDRPSTLVVRDPAGNVVVNRGLTDILPGRVLVRPSPAGTSGMDFSADRRFLYFTMLDAGPVFSTSRLVRVDIGRGSLDIVAEDLGGPGGGLTPDGTRYLFARAQGDAYGIAAWDLAKGSFSWVRRPEPGVYFHAPVASPDGRRLLAIRSDVRGTRLALLDAETGAMMAAPPAPFGPALEASWIDDERIVYVAEAQGRMQVFVGNLAGGTWQRVSKAPYLAFNPQSDGRVVRFLNREGWTWTLDEVFLPEVPATPVGAEAGGNAKGPWVGMVTAGSSPKLVLRETDSPEPSTAYRRRLNVEPPPERVVSDEPYSQLDGLLNPQVRGPWFVARDSYSVVTGVGALGGDRLGYHRWALGVGVDLSEPQPSAQFDYRNSLLAPLFINVSVGRYVSRERVDQEGPDGHVPDIVAKEMLAAIALQRSWYDSVIVWGWRLNDVVREFDNEESAERRRFVGAFLGAGYGAAERTPYSGVRRRLSFGSSSTYFPKGLSTVDFHVVDVGGNAGFVIPLPLSRRHTLRIDGRGRTLRGAPEALGLLQVGGGGGVLAGFPDVTGDRAAGVLPPSLRFFEPLRGFEDLARYGSHVVSGEVAYRFPFIIDQGTASSLSFMPSSFLREVALEPFGAGATLLDDSDPAWVAGGSLDVGVAFWLIPLDLRFQLARRFSDDESWAFYFTILGNSP
jgi:hypothetical protein